MKSERTEIDAPDDHPCRACPWLTANHRRPHPDGYYSDANRRRLWNGLRTGDAPGMTCHPTDPCNQPVADATRTRECAGAWILLGREMRSFEHARTFAAYRRGRRLAMTREGLWVVLSALLPAPLGRGLSGLTIDLDQPVSIGLRSGR